MACVALAAMLGLSVVETALAGPPTDQLRGSIDHVVKILSDPQLKGAAKATERRRAIRTVANEIFDFGEISQRSLAAHWRARSPQERQEFIALFGDLLENSYITKIESYSGEKIAYVGETMDGDVAVVKTRIVTRQGAEIPVDYRMLRAQQQWRAYDVNIEGVSLVGNYRVQFNSIISRSGYADLVAKLKAKRDERPEARGVGSSEEPASAPGPTRAAGRSLP